MDKLIIAEVRAEIDGEYDLDLQGFTHYELHAIKKATELTAGDLSDAYERMDQDIIIAMALVVLMREGKITGKPWLSPELKMLWSAPIGTIYLQSADEEADADPPAEAPDEPASESASRSESSGADTSDSSEHPENGLSPTGDPTSLITSTYAPET